MDGTGTKKPNFLAIVPPIVIVLELELVLLLRPGESSVVTTS